ncbi:MAG: threonine synthase [Promethearchaeia archaeon]
MKQKYELKCMKCSQIVTDRQGTTIKCPKCDAPLTIEMNGELLKEKISKDAFYRKEIKSMWSFFEFLPLLHKKHICSLKEGNTPLLKSKRLAQKYDLRNLHFKLDFLNPTGSFKDRQISMGISKAREREKTSVITMSSGNVGAAVAAYSARTGMKNIILVPAIASQSKIIQILQYGGNVIKINSDSTDFISQIVQNAAQKFSMGNLITASIYNPFINNGAKTIAYEIALQCKKKEKNLPDVIIIPVGGSGLLSGVYEGFRELIDLNWIEKMPRLFGVQPEGCAPFVRAIQEDLSPEYLFKHPWQNIDTISTALADDIPLDCYTGIPAIKESKGYAVAVSDNDTLKASKHLSVLEGLFAEPSSCVPIAALKDLLEEDLIKKEEKILCLLTGSGFKDIKSIKSILQKPLEVEKDFDWKKTFAQILSSNNEIG